MRRKMLMLLSVLAVVAWFNATPASAEELAGTSAAPAVESAPVPGGCEQAFDLPLIPQTGGMCPAAAAPLLSSQPLENPFAGRTCRCSCGFPCKKDADCGPGGICSAGITCC
jgi:hypothetical protein